MAVEMVFSLEWRLALDQTVSVSWNTVFTTYGWRDRNLVCLLGGIEQNEGE